MYKYKIFGLNVSSDFEMKCYQSDFDDFDVIVINSGNYVEEEIQNELINMTQDRFWFHIKDAGVFEVLNGNEIIVTPYKYIDYKTLELFILGTGLGVIMIQNNTFPLHGAFVEYKGIGFGIVGESGAGKTSLATGITLESGKIITDDVMRVTYSNGLPFVNPSYPSQKIWSSTAKALNIDITSSKPIMSRSEKYFIENELIFLSKSIQLQYIFEVVESDIESVQIVSMNEVEKLDLLLRNSYRYFVIGLSNKLKEHFKDMMRLSNNIEAYIIRRPRNRFTVDEQIRAIEEIVGVRNEEIS